MFSFSCPSSSPFSSLFSSSYPRFLSEGRRSLARLSTACALESRARTVIRQSLSSVPYLSYLGSKGKSTKRLQSKPSSSPLILLPQCQIRSELALYCQRYASCARSLSFEFPIYAFQSRISPSNPSHSALVVQTSAHPPIIQLFVFYRNLHSLLGLKLAKTRNLSFFGTNPIFYEEHDSEAYTVLILQIGGEF